MPIFRPSPPAKRSDLQPRELAALRDVSDNRSVELTLLHRLQKLGFIEQESGAWAITQHGHIFLMFQAAK
jgi:ribosomal protein S19E (S16A)